MTSLTIGIVFSYEPLTQLKRCLEALSSAVAKLRPQLDQVEWVLIATPQAHHHDFSFFHGKVILSSDENLANNRSLAIQIGTGEFFYFIDPDCWVQPQTLQILLRKIQNQPSDVFAAAGPNILCSSNPQLHRMFHWLGRLKWLNGGVSQISTNGKDRFDWHSPTCNILYRKSALGSGLYSNQFPRVGEDLEFHFRLSRTQKKILICSDACVWHEQPSQFFSYLKKTFFYGVAQTQLLKVHPKSFANRRLALLFGATGWFLVALALPNQFLMSFILVTALSVLLALLLEILFYEREKDVLSFSSSFILILMSYLLGQLSGLMIPVPRRQNAPATRANTEYFETPE